MKLAHPTIAAALALAFSGAAFAQAGTVQRDANQQQRIEQGLKSGRLNTREAARLEGEETKVEKDQARAMRDGKLSPAEKARLAREQNNVSRDIYREKHDAQTGNPASASSQRMQADVRRNINQQARIEQGVKSGSASTRAEAHAGRNGNVSAHEQHRVQKKENKQSHHIYREKHDKK
ncbi:MAG TPA: hypothetical protein VEU32_00520 [Burkholderiales bacterium]|nr:hypothetical protein [Burkholderiales bacterium]